MDRIITIKIGFIVSFPVDYCYDHWDNVEINQYDVILIRVSIFLISVYN